MFIHPSHHIFDKCLGLNVPAYSLLVSFCVKLFKPGQNFDEALN